MYDRLRESDEVKEIEMEHGTLQQCDRKTTWSPDDMIFALM